MSIYDRDFSQISAKAVAKGSSAQFENVLQAALDEIARLRAGLEPFADQEVADGIGDGPDDELTHWPAFRLGDFRRAHALIHTSTK